MHRNLNKLSKIYRLYPNSRKLNAIKKKRHSPKLIAPVRYGRYIIYIYIYIYIYNCNHWLQVSHGGGLAIRMCINVTFLWRLIIVMIIFHCPNCYFSCKQRIYFYKNETRIKSYRAYIAQKLLFYCTAYKYFYYIYLPSTAK